MQANQPGDGRLNERDGDASSRCGALRSSPTLGLVLALVIEEPSHGYEIDQRYELRFGAFLPLSTNRVYGAIERLHVEGLIELLPAARGRGQRRMRRSFRATRAGAEAFRSWVAERINDDSQRVELLARMLATAPLGLQAAVEIMDRCERECVEQLMALPGESPALVSGEAGLDEIMGAALVDQQRRVLRAQRDWAVHVRGALMRHRQWRQSKDEPAVD